MGSAAVWARSLPDDVRNNPLSWPGRVADGVASSLCRLLPADANDPVNVKYSLLAATTCFDLKEAAEEKTLLVDEKYRGLSNGIKGFGAIYMASKAFVVFGDPSFPEHYKAITQTPGLAGIAIPLMACSLRSDE